MLVWGAVMGRSRLDVFAACMQVGGYVPTPGQGAFVKLNSRTLIPHGSTNYPEFHLYLPPRACLATIRNGDMWQRETTNNVYFVLLTTG